MTDTDATNNANLAEYSVSELSNALKRTVEDTFGYVRVRGEISGLARPRSGHVYFGLKDEKSVMDAVCWRGNAGRLRFQPEDGLEVICTGKLSTYPARSKYQMIVDHMEPAGIGALLAQLEERRKKLSAEGLFAEERKQAVPALPEVIGVVTSPTGAVIRDILHRLADRFPRQVLVWPVRVQGESAAAEIAAAIDGFNQLKPNPDENVGGLPRPDLIIVARGGGSIEDLWSFNEEIVVRAAAASQIPLISAVGHETDTTLIDHASDRRAPTPTAAAEMAVPVRADLLVQIQDLTRRQATAAIRLVDGRRRDLEGLARGLRGPADLLANAEQRLDDVGARLDRALISLRQEKAGQLQAVAAGLRPSLLRRDLERRRDVLKGLSDAVFDRTRWRIERARERLASETKLLVSLSYENVLRRGYAVVRDKAGRPLIQAKSALPGMNINVEFQDGAVDATVSGLGKKAATKQKTKAPTKPKAAKKGGPDDAQGSLL